jgi:hypothetical protein
MLNLRRGRRVALAAAAAVALSLAVGCGPQTATVQGKVTVNGEPLKAGSLQFKSASGLVVAAPIQPDGTYTAVNVPVGTSTVAISAMDPKYEEKMLEMAGRAKQQQAGEGGGAAAGGRAAPKPNEASVDWEAVYRLVDEKFTAFDTSGLTVNVVGPTTTYDIPATRTKKK